MKVFISWSGPVSRQIAESLKRWIPSVIQAVKPYFSPEDNAKGSRWSDEISTELEASSFGILCLTRENLSAPWIMFEAGALSKNLEKGKVCPLLCGVEVSDVPYPLAMFQATPFERAEVEKLMKGINSELGKDALDPEVLQSVFNKFWPDLQESVSQILSTNVSDDEQPIRSDREIVEEILGHVRELSDSFRNQLSTETLSARDLQLALQSIPDDARVLPRALSAYFRSNSNLTARERVRLAHLSKSDLKSQKRTLLTEEEVPEKGDSSEPETN